MGKVLTRIGWILKNNPGIWPSLRSRYSEVGGGYSLYIL
jgi:hypothetical protein